MLQDLRLVRQLAQAPAYPTASPATMRGLRAAQRSAAACSIPDRSPVKCRGITVTPGTRASGSIWRIMNSQGMDTNTGPFGGAMASLKARWRTRGISSGSPREHAPHGPTWCTAWPGQPGSRPGGVTSSFCCWQHSTTSGTRERQALKRFPKPWAITGVTWTTSTPGLPVILADPIPAPTVMFSCRHSM